MTEDDESDSEESSSSRQGQGDAQPDNEMKDSGEQSDDDEKENKENKENEEEKGMEIETQASNLQRHWPEYDPNVNIYSFNFGLTPRICPPCSADLVPIRTKSFKLAKGNTMLDYSRCGSCDVSTLDEKTNPVIFVHEDVLIWNLVSSTHEWECYSCVQKAFRVCW